MQASGVNLAKNVTATTTAVTWKGGRTALVLSATAYGTTVQLQTQASNGTWVSVNATTYSADQVTPYDLPEGQYRINISGGTTTALYADLVAIPYG